MLRHKLLDLSERTVELPLNFKININNFGPLRQGNVELKPLTVFIGPNNSGKSYAALLMHSALKAGSSLSRYVSTHYYHDKTDVYDLKDSFEQWRNKKETTFVLPDSYVRKSVEGILNEWKKDISAQISRHFSSDLDSLVHMGSDSFSIRVQSGILKCDIQFKNKNLTVDADAESKLKIRIKFNPDEKNQRVVTHAVLENEIIISCNISQSKISVEDIDEMVQVHLGDYFCTPDSFYFPAARSGILQGHRVIAASVVQNATYAGLDSFEIPKLSGVVADFIGHLLMLQVHKSPFFEDAQKLEDQILHGKIKLEEPSRNSISEIKYIYKNQDIPLYRASSTVSELAPFVLYLKYVVDAKSVLIIEEPEAHLHASNQALFAKLLVRLIRKGLKIVITTHSPFILDQLSNLLKTGKMTDSVRKDMNVREYLKKEEVAVYTIEQNPDNEIKSIYISEEDGISQEEIVEVSRNLYEEAQKFQDCVNNGRSDI